MSHDDHGHPAARDLQRDLQDLTYQLRIQRRRWFIEKHHCRLHRKGSRNRHPLLLAARQRIGIPVSVSFQPYSF
jgi:hypothetical protein